MENKNILKVVLSVITVMTTISFIFALIQFMLVAYLQDVNVSSVWNLKTDDDKNSSNYITPILVLSIIVGILLIALVILQITKFKNNKINLPVSIVLIVLIIVIFILTLVYLNDFVIYSPGYSDPKAFVEVKGSYYISNSRFTPFLTIYECSFGIIINSLIATLIIFISSIYGLVHKENITE